MHSKKPSKINTRTRSGTTSSAYAGTDESITASVLRTHTPSAPPETENKTPTRGTFSEEVHHHPLPRADETENVPSSNSFIRKPSNPKQHSPTISGLTGTSADESDTDFQSAYSTSPRDSYGFGNENLKEHKDLTLNKPVNFHHPNITSAGTSLLEKDIDTSGDSANTLAITA